MIAVPEKIQLQISEAVSIIAASDFPEDWEQLLPVRFATFTGKPDSSITETHFFFQNLIGKLSTTDYQVNNGVLQTAHSIFKPWRSQFRSDRLFLDIQYVLKDFCEPYKQLFAVCVRQAYSISFSTVALIQRFPCLVIDYRQAHN
jgi:exportin-2 (importin alpha re-exporter)